MFIPTTYFTSNHIQNYSFSFVQDSNKRIKRNRKKIRGNLERIFLTS